MKDMVLTTCNSNPDVNYLLNPEYGYSHITGDNAGVIAEIRRERTVELAQEGNRRWDDLLRWREGMCNAQPIYGQYFPHLGAFDIDGDDVYDIYLYDDTMDPKKSGVDKENGLRSELTTIFQMEHQDILSLSRTSTVLSMRREIISIRFQ